MLADSENDMQRLILAITVLTVLAGGILLWTRYDRSGVVEPDIGAPAEPARPPAITLESGAAAATGAAQTGDPERLPVTGTETVAARNGALVRVIDKQSDAPVAFAHVFLFETDEAGLKSLAPIALYQPLQFLEEKGQHFRADERGEVRLPEVDGLAAVGARAEHKTGFMRLHRGATELVIEVVPDLDVVIAVVDQQGKRVAGVPVMLRMGDGTRALTTWRSETDKRGQVRIRETPPTLARSSATSLTACLAFPVLDGPVAELDLLHPPSDPIELLLPPTGRVEVALEGSSWGSDTTVELAPAAGSRSGVMATASVTAEGGAAVFPFVGLALTLEASATPPGSFSEVEHEAIGPTAPGQTVLMRLDPRVGNQPVIVARLVDEAGAPLREARLNLRIMARRGGSTTSTSSSIVTNNEGAIRVEIHDDMGAGAERSIELSRTDGGGQVILEVPEKLLPGENDLGTFAVTRAPMLAGGRVVRNDGEPVEGAAISVLRKHVFDPQHPEHFFWQTINNAGAETDATGHFECRGIADAASEFAVSVTHQDYLPIDKLAILYGAATLQLTLERAGGVSGNVLLGDQLESYEIVVQLEHRNDTTNLRPDPDGGFRFESLRPGNATVTVRAFGDAKPFLTVEGVATRPGTVTEDPRLQDIDLDGILHPIAFTVVDEAGDAIVDATAVGLPSGGNHYEGHLLPRGQARFLTHGTLDVLVYADGFRRRTVHGVRDGDQVVLTRQLEVNLQLPAGIAVPAPPFRLRARLEPMEPEESTSGEVVLIRGRSHRSTSSGGLPWASPASGETTASGLTTLLVDSPGRYRQSWTLFLDKGNSSSGTVLNVDDQDLVEVRDAPAPQTFPAAVSAAALQAALQAAGSPK